MSAATARARIDYRRPKGGAVRSALATVDSSATLTPRARSANDFYVEERWFVDALLDAERFDGLVWDPAAGRDTIPSACRARDIPAMGSDLVDRDNLAVHAPFDFLDEPLHMLPRPENIICNPPFDLAERFIERSLSLATRKVAMLLRWSFAEGGSLKTARGRLHSWCLDEAPLARIYVAVNRVSMPPGDLAVAAKGGAVAFGWFVWEHGHKGPATFHRLRKPV
jgi:hypothetical protein